MLNAKIFKSIIESTPLVSIDLLIKKDNKFLLGRRINKPAQGCFFSIGGRVYKNETIKQAMTRIAKDELNIELESMPKFIGVFEHFYKNSIYKAVSTHYIDLAYEVNVASSMFELPTQQHDKYQWFSIDEISNAKQVHRYVKDYFKS